MELNGEKVAELWTIKMLFYNNKKFDIYVEGSLY